MFLLILRPGLRAILFCSIIPVQCIVLSRSRFGSLLSDSFQIYNLVGGYAIAARSRSLLSRKPPRRFLAHHRRSWASIASRSRRCRSESWGLLRFRCRSTPKPAMEIAFRISSFISTPSSTAGRASQRLRVSSSNRSRHALYASSEAFNGSKRRGGYSNSKSLKTVRLRADTGIEASTRPISKRTEPVMPDVSFKMLEFNTLTMSIDRLA